MIFNFSEYLVRLLNYFWQLNSRHHVKHQLLTTLTASLPHLKQQELRRSKTTYIFLKVKNEK